MITTYLTKHGFTKSEIIEIQDLIEAYYDTMKGSPFITHQECINRVYLADDEFSNKMYRAYDSTKRYKLTLTMAMIAHGNRLQTN